MSTPTPQQILDLALPENDSGASTVRGYLVKLLDVLWDEGDGFSGKRPFGNSGWQSDFDRIFIDAGWVVDGSIGRDGYFGAAVTRQVDDLMHAAIRALGATGGEPK